MVLFLRVSIYICDSMVLFLRVSIYICDSMVLFLRVSIYICDSMVLLPIKKYISMYMYICKDIHHKQQINEEHSVFIIFFYILN